jgi:hypothetical protein
VGFQPMTLRTAKLHSGCAEDASFSTCRRRTPHRDGLRSDSLQSGPDRRKSSTWRADRQPVATNHYAGSTPSALPNVLTRIRLHAKGASNAASSRDGAAHKPEMPRSQVVFHPAEPT